jgi:hypothetical protein
VPSLKIAGRLPNGERADAHFVSGLIAHLVPVRLVMWCAGGTVGGLPSNDGRPPQSIEGNVESDGGGGTVRR